MKIKYRNDKPGFTLVELMVVVAIIGILSAVAIPSIDNYRNKAKTSEAKMALSAAYTAMESIHASYDTYASCLEFGGYGHSGSTYYSLGLSDPSDLNSVVREAGGEDCEGGDEKSCFVGTKTPGGVASTVNQRCNHLGSANGYEVSANGFTVGANGIISAAKVSNNYVEDIWSIDHEKELVHKKKGY